MVNSLSSYEAVVGKSTLSQLYQLADDMEGMKIVHVNSTREGGGVAEILQWLIPLMKDVGLDAHWETVEGNPDFFKTTKAFHNGLQGTTVAFTKSMAEAYEATLRENAERLRPKLEDADYVVIHDPQPAGLLDLCPKRKGKWIWRCHIDASHPMRQIWNYVKAMIVDYDASIFSMPQFAQPLPHLQFIIAPSIDPLSEKNYDLPADEVHSAREQLGISSDRPLITQVSRFDRFKDPIGVINAFKILRGITDAELLLVGGGATDDPEGPHILEQVQDAAEDDPRIHVSLLPADSHRMINALQRASTIVLQKSLQEGFGLTVTEALWKSRPVVGGNVGGIRSQIHNYFNGFLVDTPEGAALRIRYLLRRPDKAKKMGRRGHQFVKSSFLLTRHLREYLTLMRGLQNGAMNRLVA